MRFGVHLPNVGPLSDAAAVGPVAQAAERLNYDSVWVNDHLVYTLDRAARHFVLGSMSAPMKAEYLEAVVTLSYVAGLTERVRLGTSVVVLSFRDPVVLAKQLATLDRYAAGRLTVGVGVGARQEEYEVLGVPFDGRGRLVNDRIRRLRQLWATGRIGEESTGDAGPDFLPSPVQQPGPPLWIAGHTDPALRRVVAHGDGWLPWALTEAEFEERAAELRRLTQEAGRALATVGGQYLIAYNWRGGESFARAKDTLVRRFETWDVASGRALWGYADQLRARLHRLEELGMEEVILGFVSETVDDLIEDLAQFAAEVMPEFTERPPELVGGSAARGPSHTPGVADIVESSG